MKKTVFRVFSLVLVLVLLLPVMSFATTPKTTVSTQTASAGVRDTSFQEYLANDLKSINMFKGTDKGFQLENKLTRTEAVVMIIRMLGKEDEATGKDWKHPFTDVKNWASKYIGYAYQNGLTSGTTDTHFDGVSADGDRCNAKMYLTFTLRALGYTDKGDSPDFTYSDPFTLAKSVGILPEDVDTENFIRADVVIICAKALSATLKGTTTTLAEKLIKEGVFTQKAFDDCKYLRGATGGSETETTSKKDVTYYKEYTWLPDVGAYFGLKLQTRKEYTDGYAFVYDYSSKYTYQEALTKLTTFYQELTDYGITSSSFQYGYSYSAWYTDFILSIYITNTDSQKCIIVSVQDIYSN